jgi:cellulose synthase (UDP-forming)
MSSNAVSTVTWARTSGPGQPHHQRPHHQRPRRLATVTTPTARHARTAGWADLLGRPSPESDRSRDLAHLGGFAAMTALVGYLTWRIAFTLPAGGANAIAAWTLIAFEAIPLIGMSVRMATLWNIDSAAPRPVSQPPAGLRVAVLIPTYDEPAEVIAPTIAASVALEPAHQTWVLDDGDRPWVQEICEQYGARYVAREAHDHAKAGNLNNALDLMAAEAAAGAEDIDVIAVLDCDHVPLESFLTATLGWFADPSIALVQGPQSFYNAGAFDDDGVNGEQGLFFNVLMAARNHRDAGPFWCGSTALVRTAALREIGGVSTDTIVEDMHTTLGLLRAGWRTAYHHQTLAVGLAPATADQYLLQRRRWGMGAMQVLTKEKLWAAKHWLSWRNYYEYLTGTLWWLEGAATVLVLMVPVALLLSGAQTSTAGPLAFTGVFAATFVARLWGAKRLYRHQLSWTNALALRVLRIPVGISCVWWLLTRRTLEFQVTPKEGSAQRTQGRVPRVLLVLLAGLAVVVGYAAAGLAGAVPWRATPGATVASGAWLLVAATTVAFGVRRIRAAEFASSRRNAHRFGVRATVSVDGAPSQLVDASVGGVAIRVPATEVPGAGLVQVGLPGMEPVKLSVVRAIDGGSGDRIVSLQVLPGDWAAMRTLSLWLFHTPAGAVSDLPDGVPAAASIEPAPSLSVRQSRAAAARVRPAAAVLGA